MPDHLLHLSPTDVLFFRDGRPMEGASTGHGAAWPLPHVFSAAIHHALHRSGCAEDCHAHFQERRSHRPQDEDRTRLFGALQTAGPFPIFTIDSHDRWLFPRPADAAQATTSATTHRPLSALPSGIASSLHPKLRPLGNNLHPSKSSPEAWLTADAYSAYLNQSPAPSPKHFLPDSKVFSAEHQIGIGIDPSTLAQDGTSFYSASYLRLQDDAHIGLIARCMDKGRSGTAADLDLIAHTFPNSGSKTRIVAGGQQRTCTLTRHTQPDGSLLPFPLAQRIEGTKIRWTLLTPAIFPHILPDPEKGIKEHQGGWCPTWIDPSDLSVQLKDPDQTARADREPRDGWRRRVAALPPIDAHLIAAIVPRAIPVTGWALPHQADPAHGGARATHLAVPAGAVYYFECGSTEAARSLADALNWHGQSCGDRIANRRSTLLGEKGYGIGLCGAWQPHPTTVL